MREHVPDSGNLEDLELVCAKMTTICNKKVLFCSLYWPDPDNGTGCWLEKFNIFLDHASETYDNMVIGGDLNLACEKSLLFGQAKSLARTRAARFARPDRLIS